MVKNWHMQSQQRGKSHEIKTVWGEYVVISSLKQLPLLLWVGVLFGNRGCGNYVLGGGVGCTWFTHLVKTQLTSATFECSSSFQCVGKTPRITSWCLQVLPMCVIILGQQISSKNDRLNPDNIFLISLLFWSVYVPLTNLYGM